jgi:hypothetical protein
MAASAINNIGWYLQYSSGWIGQSGPRSGPGSAGRLADTAAVGSSASAVGPGYTEAFAQNLHLFMQALYQALSSTDSKQQPASPRSQAYQHTQKGLQGRIESLIGALKRPGGSSSSASGTGSSDASLNGLQGAFNRLSRDLGASTFSPLSALNTLSGLGSDLTLHGWLQGLKTSLQHGTARLSSIGNLVDVVV